MSTQKFLTHYVRPGTLTWVENRKGIWKTRTKQNFDRPVSQPESEWP